MTPKEKAEQLIRLHLTAIVEETMDNNKICDFYRKKMR